MINRVFGNMEVFVIPRYLEYGKFVIWRYLEYGNIDVWKYRCTEV